VRDPYNTARPGPGRPFNGARPSADIVPLDGARSE
jgi:hypothetical protein